MNLLHLATPIQEEILNWSEVESERDPVSELSGVNYFFGLTTTISPDQRQLLCSS
jgi:hypothetical protein